MSNVVVESADGHRMTVDEALQIIYDFNAFNKIKIVLEGEVGDVWGECLNVDLFTGTATIAEVHAEYSVAEALVSIAYQIQNRNNP